MTKLCLYIITMVLAVCSCSSKTENKNSSNGAYKTKGLTSIAVEKRIHDFGDITKGEIVVCNFKLINKGENPLIIKKIEASCGCANFRWNKKPIPPGGKTNLEVEFNSEGRYGKQYKVISIFANIPGQVKDVAVAATIK